MAYYNIQMYDILINLHNILGFYNETSLPPIPTAEGSSEPVYRAGRANLQFYRPEVGCNLPPPKAATHLSAD